ncbi:zinc carboxypeptidase a [Fusarium oxysporum f. sp. phaseoli]
MNTSPELFAQLTNRLRICYQTFGDPSDPAVILVPGNADSMIVWAEDLIEKLQSSEDGKKYFVIRFDPRDTGLSTEFPVPGGYSIGDMAGDIEGLANHLNLNDPSKGFHIVGLSKGGPVAYTVAARMPQHVKSLSLLYTSPGVSPELPIKGGLDLGFQPMLAGFGDQRETAIKNGMTVYDALTTQPDAEERKEVEKAVRRLVERDIKGGTLYSKAPNHGAASYEKDGWPGVDTLKMIKSKVSYDGWKAFSITARPSDKDILSLLKSIDHVSLSCGQNHDVFEVAIPPGKLDAFKRLGLKTAVVSDNMGAEIAQEGSFGLYQATAKRPGANAKLPDKSYFKSYHSFEQHLQFLSDLQASFPKNSEVFTAGMTVQNREIQGIHLWGKGDKGRNPAIVWHANSHAREWISGMTVEYMAWKLVQGYQNKDRLVRDTLNNYDFYIIPIANPDGFVYTITDDRLWRKNRQKRAGQKCIGTDLNRNWPHEWDIPGGSSTDTCNETYRGMKAGDTPENKALVKHTKSVAQKNGIKSYIDFHSFSQLILLPYGYTCDTNITDIKEQMELAGGVADAIKQVNDLNFYYGPTCQTIYQTSGGSSDWVYDVAGAELAWGMELRPQRLRGNGFVLPPKQIVESGEEIWAGMRYLFENF